MLTFMEVPYDTCFYMLFVLFFCWVTLKQIISSSRHVNEQNQNIFVCKPLIYGKCILDRIDRNTNSLACKTAATKIIECIALHGVHFSWNVYVRYSTAFCLLNNGRHNLSPITLSEFGGQFQKTIIQLFISQGMFMCLPRTVPVASLYLGITFPPFRHNTPFYIFLCLSLSSKS